MTNRNGYSRIQLRFSYTAGYLRHRKEEALMKKILVVLLAVLTLASVLCGCSNIKNKDYTAAKFEDSSVSQQRWLRDPETDLVLNPAEYQNGESSNKNRLGLNVGYIDESHTVLHSFDDILFLAESSAANAASGDEFFKAVWDLNDPECNLKYSATRLTVDTSVPGRTAIDGIIAASSSSFDDAIIQFKDTLNYRWDVELLAIVDVQSLSQDTEWGLQISVSAGSNRFGRVLQADGEQTGKFVFNISDVVKGNLKNADEQPSARMNLMFRVCTKDDSELQPRIVLGDYKILAIPKTINYSSSSSASSWAPYALKTSLSYANGSAVKVEDFFAVDNTDEANIFKNVVARKITYTDASQLYLCGKLEGKVSWDDTKVLISAEGDEYSYVIAPKRKQGLEFYASESDMLNRTNGSETPDENTCYWSLPLGIAEADDTAYAAVAFGKAGESIEALGEKAKAVITSTKAEKYLDRAVKFWDWYLQRATLPDEYVNYDGPVA